jgi:hypothetical protein
MHMARRAVWISLVLVSTGFVGRMVLVSKRAAYSQAVHTQAVPAQTAQTQRPAPPAALLPQGNAFVDVSVDYGAQLLLTDSQGRRTGFDPASPETLNGIPDVSYADDSISDATDDSSGAAVSESRVLEIHPKTAGQYSLKVLPTDRNSYNIQFFCTGNGSPVNISAHGLGIAAGEDHSFTLAIAPDCSGRLVSGAFAEQAAPGSALLTYAYPKSDHIRLAGVASFRLVILYDPRVSPSSFSATLNGHTIANLFHPHPNAIESVTIPVKPGRNLLQLSVAGTSEGGSPLSTTDTFVVEAE